MVIPPEEPEPEQIGQLLLDGGTMLAVYLSDDSVALVTYPPDDPDGLDVGDTPDQILVMAPSQSRTLGDYLDFAAARAAGVGAGETAQVVPWRDVALLAQHADQVNELLIACRSLLADGNPVTTADIAAELLQRTIGEDGVVDLAAAAITAALCAASAIQAAVLGGE